MEIVHVLEFLKSPREVLKALGHHGDRKSKYSELLRRASEKATSWTGLSSRLREHFLKAILDCVVIHPDSVQVKIRKEPLI